MLYPSRRIYQFCCGGRFSDILDCFHYLNQMRNCFVLHVKQNRFLHKFYLIGQLPELLAFWMYTVQVWRSKILALTSEHVFLSSMWLFKGLRPIFHKFNWTRHVLHTANYLSVSFTSHFSNNGSLNHSSLK